MRAAVAAAVAIALAAGRAHAGDPLRDHYTIETDHFVIHYYEPLGDVARRIGVLAERAHRNLVPALDHRPATKTIVVLVDDTDSANGFASVLPRNTIFLFATAPGSFTELDDHDDWLHGLITHEYTHILHLDTMEGLPNIYNRIFGKTWAPNQVMPRWLIEGVATYEESKRSAGGRNRGSRFDQLIRIARHTGVDMRLDQISGAPRQFPRSNAAYVYGSHFLRYVFDRFGDDTLRQMSHTSGRHPVPFAINRQIAKVTGRPFTELYDDWKRYIRDRYGMQEQAAERRGLVTGAKRTQTAETNFFPRYTGDSKEIIWLQSDGYRRPMLRVQPVGDPAAAKDLVEIQGIGQFDVLPDGSLVYEQSGRLHRREYAFQDLYRWDRRTGERVRLTFGARARDPAASPDGRRVAYSRNDHGRSVLAVMDAAPGAEPSIVWRGEGRYDQAFEPAWSPDGTRIAFSAWRKGGFRDILIVELASGAVEAVTTDRALDMAPSWAADGKTLYFDSDRSGIQNIYAYDLEARRLWQVTNVLGGAFFARPSPDGTRLVFQAAVSRGGYDLHELPIDRARWLPAREMVDDRPPPTVVRDDEAKVSAPRRYRAAESLAPQAWALQTVFGDNPTATIQTGGGDAFNLHSYQLSVGSSLDRGDVNVAALYGYGLFRHSLRVAASRTVGERSGFRIDGINQRYRQEDWSATVSSSIPFESRAHGTWSLSFEYDVDWFRMVDGPELMPDPNQRVPLLPATDYVQAGVGARLGFSTSRGVVYGIGPQFRLDATVGLRFDHPTLGATYKNVTLSYNASAYQSLWGKTPVLAARIAGSFRAGDLVRLGSFSLGGVPPQDVVRSIVDSTRAGVIGFLRGYAPRAVVGNQFHLLNLEYRQELRQIERGLATLPVYFRRVTMALLADVGTAFDATFDADKHLRTSVGGALRLDAFFGYFIPGTFELGYARGVQEGGIHESWLRLTGSL